ncbi:MAG TPA: hypothetical protein VN043_13905 [Rhodanobacter sp.]|nr:hypothetical protein [Rhodanobacter sp.]
MSFRRHTSSFALSLVAGLLLSSSVYAAEVSMADGSISFTTPDNWISIMQTQGESESQVFQVPDPSPTGKTSLARVTVTVTHVPDINHFQQFMAEATAKALALPSYKVVPEAPQPDSNIYTARENGVAFSYTERYWLKHGLAIQLRCMRPSQSLAGASWKADFDKGCASLAKQLK